MLVYQRNLYLALLLLMWVVVCINESFIVCTYVSIFVYFTYVCMYVRVYGCTIM